STGHCRTGCQTGESTNNIPNNNNGVCGALLCCSPGGATVTPGVNGTTPAVVPTTATAIVVPTATPIPPTPTPSPTPTPTPAPANMAIAANGIGNGTDFGGTQKNSNPAKKGLTAVINAVPVGQGN